MLWSNFSDCFLFQEWISLWRSCVLRYYNFETAPHHCHTCPLAGSFLSPGGGWTSHFLCCFSQFVPPSFTLALPFSGFWIFDPAALRIIYLLSYLLLLSFGMLLSLQCLSYWWLWYHFHCRTLFSVPHLETSHKYLTFPPAYGSLEFFFLAVSLVKMQYCNCCLK